MVMVGLSGMGYENSHSRETPTGHGRLERCAPAAKSCAHRCLSRRHSFIRRCYGSCYRSKAFAKACRDLGLKHVRTRPYTPKTTDVMTRAFSMDLRYSPAAHR
ncbi:hypothetical protein D3227_38445 [Mesorhizobium waimense]|uniref:Transposase n=1 Tax=Mesorhizobium waimense TaxID=1300307 RepID=A0A3A5JTQ6_9HYPH|nr:hypothetical protein D3227_38445 [Mesorhizobium waimense]